MNPISGLVQAILDRTVNDMIVVVNQFTMEVISFHKLRIRNPRAIERSYQKTQKRDLHSSYFGETTAAKICDPHITLDPMIRRLSELVY